MSLTIKPSTSSTARSQRRSAGKFVLAFISRDRLIHLREPYTSRTMKDNPSALERVGEGWRGDITGAFPCNRQKKNTRNLALKCMTCKCLVIHLKRNIGQLVGSYNFEHVPIILRMLTSSSRRLLPLGLLLPPLGDPLQNVLPILVQLQLRNNNFGGMNRQRHGLSV